MSFLISFWPDPPPPPCNETLRDEKKTLIFLKTVRDSYGSQSHYESRYVHIDEVSTLKHTTLSFTGISTVKSENIQIER